ncbi:MAG: chemotaxis protein CheW [Aquabacterium sp.]
MMRARASQAGLSFSAEQLREVFDQGFAQAVVVDAARWQDFLQIRLDGQVHVLALDEVASLQPVNWVTPIPGPLPALIGLIGHKGETVPLYDLRILLGCPATVAPRWMVLSRQVNVALAFDAFDKHLRRPDEAVARPASAQASGDHIRAHLRVDEQNWPIVSLASVGNSIQEAARQCAQQQES